MLEATLGNYYGVMTKDAVVKGPGQRPPSKGAATGYLAELRGLRIAITDETSPGERVDLGLVLQMTGGGKVMAQLLFKNNVAFRCSHTPFIQTNYDPEIPPTLAKQNNIDRRLIVVRFPNEYVTENKFDASNPNHRVVDSGLKDRMETMAVREEFLLFLVRGGVAWYENPDIVKTHPPAFQAARAAWLQKGDKLQNFPRKHCIMDPHETAESDLLVVWEEEFWVRFQAFVGTKIAKEELARQMGEKGYPRKKRRSETGNQDLARALCYLGFKCEYLAVA
jgi:phage/plasmid-associated DNA primase